MAQGTLGKKSKGARTATNAKHQQKKAKAFTKKGARAAAPRRPDAVSTHTENMEITKTINKHNETMLAAKAVQGGGRLKTTDLRVKGKETAKDIRRTMLKRKTTKLEDTLKQLKAAEEKS